MWSAGDVFKEPTHLSQRVVHGVPGVVVWPCCKITLRASAKTFSFFVNCLMQSGRTLSACKCAK